MRSRFFRYSDRASYKSSEVAALFLIGLFLSGVTVLVCVAIDFAMKAIFGSSR